MLNQVILVGRIKEMGDDYIVLGISDAKLPNKIHYINIYFSSKQILDNTKQYVSIDDIVGIKGSLKAENGLTNVIADKVTFLSSTKGGENDE